MPIFDAFVVAGIVAAFLIFAIVLAWAEIQTRNLPKVTEPTAVPQKRPPLTILRNESKAA